MNPEINTFQQATCTFQVVVEHLTILREPSQIWSRHHLQNMHIEAFNHKNETAF